MHNQSTRIRVAAENTQTHRLSTGRLVTHCPRRRTSRLPTYEWTERQWTFVAS